MLTTLTRILKYGWQGFWRNKWLSVATINILLLTLIVFQGLILFKMVAGVGLESLKDKIDVSIYFVPTADESKILQIQRQLEAKDEIKKVEYVSQEKALSIFKERHKDDPAINQALKELEGNPLSASLNIKAKNPRSYPAIAKFLGAQTNWQPFIEKMTYRQNQLVIERLSKIVSTSEKFGMALTFFLSLAAILVTFNTISLAIYSSREEVGIMRLVGSSNKFIIGPYVVTGIIYGVIAAVVSMVIMWPIVAFLSPYLKFFISDMSLIGYYADNFWSLLSYQLLFAIVLGVISSEIAIRKYVKV